MRGNIQGCENMFPEKAKGGRRCEFMLTDTGVSISGICQPCWLLCYAGTRNAHYRDRPGCMLVTYIDVSYSAQ